MPHSINPMQRTAEHGFTLVELIIALALGLTLTGAVSRIYLDSARHVLYAEELAKLQENSLVFMHLIQKEIVMAGFFAGAKNTITTPGSISVTNDCSPGWVLDVEHPLDFFDQPVNVDKSVMGSRFSGCIRKFQLVQQGTDIISIKRTAGMPTISNGQYNLHDGLEAEIKRNSFYLQVTGDADPVFTYVERNFSQDIVNLSELASMWLHHARIFYVRRYSVVPDDNVPSLMMISLQDKKLIESVLIEGIEMFHIEWGIMNHNVENGAIRFVSNPTRTQLLKANIARVYVLMRSRNAIRDYVDTKTYRLGSMPPISPGGPFLRRVFTTTVNIRNR